MMHGLENNVSVLKRWASVSDAPMPLSWDDFQRSDATTALQIQIADPELVSLLDGTASASLRVAALDGVLHEHAPSEQERTDLARKQRLQQLFDAKPMETGNLTEQLELAALDPGLAAELKQQAAAAAPTAAEPPVITAQDRVNSLNHAMTLGQRMA